MQLVCKYKNTCTNSVYSFSLSFIILLVIMRKHMPWASCWKQQQKFENKLLWIKQMTVFASVKDTPYFHVQYFESNIICIIMTYTNFVMMFWGLFPDNTCLFNVYWWSSIILSNTWYTIHTYYSVVCTNSTMWKPEVCLPLLSFPLTSSAWLMIKTDDKGVTG